MGVSLLLALGACASAQLADGQRIDSVNQLAGQWTGTVDPGRWGPATPFQLSITPAGQLTATWESNTAWGTVTVVNGRATFEMHPDLYEGTVRLFDDGGRRQLVLDDYRLPFQARVAMQK